MHAVRTMQKSMKTAEAKENLFRAMLMTIVLLALQWAGTMSAQSLGEALDATNVVWTSSGNGSFGWNISNSSPHDGAYDVSSGILSQSTATSTLQATITGPGTLKFWWKNLSSSCFLSFISGNQTLITYGGPWQTWQSATYYIGTGEQTFKWLFYVGFLPHDFSSAYVDGVSFTPGPTAPTIVQQPASVSQVRGLAGSLKVIANGTPPLAYQWQFEGQDLPGATSSILVVTNVQFSSVGKYRVAITNAYGSTISSPASLELGEVTCWGQTGFQATSVPTGATNVLAVSAGDYFNLWLSRDGSVTGFGDFTAGINAPPLNDAIAISSASFQAFALRSNRTVVVWGSNNDGETNVPPGLTNVVAIAKAHSSCLVLAADGRVTSWGDNRSGQTNVPPDLTNVVAVAAGGLASLALKEDGTVVQWGGGQSSELALTNIVAIGAGAAHYLALSSDGTVAAWGQNDSGHATVPGGLSNVVAIAAGSFHSLALRSDGIVAAWGFNSGGITDVPLSLTNVVAISAGDYHNIALVNQSPPVLHASATNLSWSAGGFSMSVPSISGHVYQLQYKPSVADEVWTSLPLVPGTGGKVTLTDASTSQGRVYRVLRW
jgi:hypothetical protein